MVVSRIVTSLLLMLYLPLANSVSEAQQEAAKIKVTVNLVTVDVVVTGKKGHIPSDLKKEDFEIYEDGKRQEILHFEFIDGRRTQRQKGAPEAGATPPPAVTAATQSGTTPADPNSLPRAGNLFLLIVDKLTSRREDLLRMKPGIDKFLDESIQPDDLLGVIEYYRGYRLTQGFTADREAVRTALYQALQRVTPELLSRSDEQQIIRTAKDMQSRASQSAGGREALMRFKGRKTVFLISRGLIPGGRTGVLSRSVIDSANKANTSIYSIDPSGIEHIDHTLPNPYADTSVRDFTSTGRVRRGFNSFDRTRLGMSFNSRDDGLTDLTKETGGRAFRNSNNYFRALETAHRESRTHYILTYSPTNTKEDGSFRKIKVRLKRRGYSLRTRRGYIATGKGPSFLNTPAAQMTHALYSPNLVTDIPTSIQPAVFMSPSGRSVAHVSVHIDPAIASFSKENGLYKGMFSLVGGVFDELGIKLYDFRRDFNVELSDKTYARISQEGMSISTTCELPPGQYQVKIVLRDNRTGKMGTQRHDLLVELDIADTPFMSSLVLSKLVLPRGAVHARDREEADAGYELLRYREFVILPSVLNKFKREDVLTLFFHAYNIAIPTDETRTLYGYRVILHKDGELYNRSRHLPLQGAAQRSTRGFVLAVQLPLNDLEAGKYQAEIEVVGPDGVHRISRRAEFTVQ